MGDYLRVCGADSLFSRVEKHRAGLPPRVRSRRNRPRSHRVLEGITSACAEQTDISAGSPGAARDYLRVCGADNPRLSVCEPSGGLPPRVRSRLGNRYRHVKPCGITSACAEQTIRPLLTTERLRDYLRVCGADGFDKVIPCAWRGLPPRVRSRRLIAGLVDIGLGITSACAEQTSISACSAARSSDYLRVCGADSLIFWNR